MKPIQLISPVDGSVWLERQPLSREDAFAAAARAKAAQKGWAARPLEERIALVKAGVAKLMDIKDTLVEELAWQMGRPVRFGPGELRGFTERATHMIAIAAAALAPLEPAPRPGFRRFIQRVICVERKRYGYRTLRKGWRQYIRIE